MTRRFVLPIALVVLCSLYAQSSVVIGRVSQKATDNLQRQIKQITASASGNVGVSATLVETGQSVAVLGDQRFPMQSVYKMPIGMAILHQVDARKLKLDQTVHVTQDEYVSKQQHSPLRDKFPGGTDITVAELLRYAVSESDGSASDVLMRLAGGPQPIMQYLKSLGIQGLIVANTEKELGSDNKVQYKNWATPNEAVALLRRVHEGRGLSKTSRSLLVRLMTETETGLHRLKGLLPAGTVVAHKTGTSLTVDGLTAATNDIGLITLPDGRHIAIAVFVSDARADAPIREAVIAKVARTVWDFWTSKGTANK